MPLRSYDEYYDIWLIIAPNDDNLILQTQRDMIPSTYGIVYHLIPIR